MKIRLFEFEDFPWFPEIIRSGGTDYLRYLLTATNIYQPITPLLVKGIEKTGSDNILDLCSGGGGAIQQVQSNIKKQFNKDIEIRLSDKFPNLEAFKYLEKQSAGKISFETDPVDAAKVPLDLKGFRTIFSGFHHFNEVTAKAVLKDAVDAKAGIGIFDGAEKNIFTILGIMIFHPLAFIFFTPFFRPFKLSRLFFTYILPLIPLYTIWDGVVSIIRLYRPTELLRLASETDDEHYEWLAGRVKNKLGIGVAYLVGYPKQV
jgi:hypothetical protein